LVKQWVDKEADVQFEVLSDYPIVRDLQLELNIVAPELKVISDLGRLEIEAFVNGKVVGPIQKPIFIGRIDLLEGEFSFFALNYPFSIKSGSYIENRSQLEFNPWYEIYAETAEPIQNVPLETTDGQVNPKDLTVTARLSGYLNEKHQLPELEAEVLKKGAGEEYPQLAYGQIISILTGIDPFASGPSLTGSANPSDFFLRQSQRYLGNQFAKYVGFREARFDISPDSFEKSRFLFTKELSERLAVTYSSTFQLHDAQPRIEIEYQIKQHISLKGERNEQGKFGIDLQLEQKF
jgi:hypothetical protein